MKVWHDDVRRPPDSSWTWARTNLEAQELLRTGQVTEISLDHDLGLHEADPDDLEAVFIAGPSLEGDGYDLVKWMCEHDLIPSLVHIHSWNPPGARKMEQALREAGCLPDVRPFRPSI